MGELKRILIFFPFLILLSWNNDKDCNVNKIVIEYIPCIANYEVWVNSTNIAQMLPKKIAFTEKKDINHYEKLLGNLKKSSEANAEKLDARIVIRRYSQNDRLIDIMILDNKLDIQYNGIFYKRNNLLNQFLKERLSDSDCL